MVKVNTRRIVDGVTYVARPEMALELRQAGDDACTGCAADGGVLSLCRNLGECVGVIFVKAPTQAVTKPAAPEVVRALEIAGALPTDAAARKAAPIFSGCLSYFPLALAEVARVSVTGNKQHALGQKLHFARDRSTDHGDCIIRHQMEFDQVDTDGHYHAAKVAWRALAQLQVLLETPK